ncbi:MAG: FKBP-type peptidyl-prolyl cis-trans isomerase [Opitutales bacterium]
MPKNPTLTLASGVFFALAFTSLPADHHENGDHEGHDHNQEAQMQGGQESDSLELFRQFGWMMSQNLQQLDLSEEEAEAFQRGLMAGLEGQQVVSEEEMPMVQQRLQAFLQNRVMSQQETRNEEFVANLAEDPNIQQTESGLYFEILEEGEGEKADEDDRVEVHYTGTLVDGTVFDSSRERGQPATFPVNRVVPGFSEGVQMVAPGGRIKLYIPPELGYGDNAPGNIPPRSMLVFDVEVLDVLEGPGEQPEMPQFRRPQGNPGAGGQ